MNNNQGETSFNNADVAPNPFAQGGNPDQGAIPTIPGFDMQAVKKAPINVHGVLTLGILCIAGVAIWGMRSIGLKGLQANAQAKEEVFMEANKGASVMTVEDQRLLADLNASRTDKQIPGDELQKNPFALSAATRPKPKAGVNAPVSPTATPEEIKAARQQDLIEALTEFKVQGVIGGSGGNGVARINGKPYRVGDKIGGKNAPEFTITSIAGREVTVTIETFTFILSMDSQ